MCYNKEASVIATLIGFTSAACAYRLGHPVIAAFIATYTTVQIAEGFIWYGIETNNVDMNQLGSSLLLSSLPSHAFVTVAVALVWCLGQKDWSKAHQQSVFRTLILLFLLSVGAMAMMLSDKQMDNQNTTVKTICDNKPLRANQSFWLCRLNWNFKPKYRFFSSVSYIIQVFILAIIFKIVYNNSPIVFYILSIYFGTIFLSIIIGLYAHGRYAMDAQLSMKLSISTLWCFFSAVASPLVVFVLWYYGRTQNK